MDAFKFDTNTWYNIQSPSQPGFSVTEDGQLLILDQTNETSSRQRFQFFPTKLNDNAYMIRCDGTGSGLYLGVGLYLNLSGNVSSVPQNWTGSVAMMVGDLEFASDLNVLWNVTSSGDGYYYVTNYASGANRWKTYNTTDPLYSPNYNSMYLGTPESVDQTHSDTDELRFKFNFTATSTKINDAEFSTAQSPSVAIASLLKAADKRKLSGGAIAGIVVGSVVGLVIFLAIGFFLLRWRRQTKVKRNAQSEKAGEEASD